MFRKTALVALAIWVAMGLTACGKEEENLSEFDKTLAGIDKDNDGIRDEIAERMHKEFAESINADEMKIMDEHARVFQEIMTVNMEDRNAVLIARDHLDVVMNCAVYVFGDGLDYDGYTILLTRLRQWYFNTKARREVRREFILRSKEYHYQSDNFNGVNTCDFEFSPETKRMIEIRQEISKRNKEKEAQKQGVEPNQVTKEVASEVKTEDSFPELPKFEPSQSADEKGLDVKSEEVKAEVVEANESKFELPKIEESSTVDASKSLEEEASN